MPSFAGSEDWFSPWFLMANTFFSLSPWTQVDARGFVQREEFRGLLVPLFSRSLDTDTRRGFEAMNQALKERAEASGLSG